MHRHREDAATPGAQYLKTLSEAERRGQGKIYTSLHLVRFILGLAGYVVDATLPLCVA